MAPIPNQSRFQLANEILNLIRDARFAPGHRLREQQLGDMLAVSRTPVRAALALLAERGIVETRRNVGYLLVRAPGEADHIAMARPETAEEGLYRQIVDDRLAGRIPLSLTQSEITRRYAIDRTALLKTLSRLSEDGLVVRNKGRGWTFLPTLDSAVSLQGSYDFRLTVEPAAFLLPSFKPDFAALERARLQHLYFESHPDIATVDRRQLFDADAAFHEMLAEFSGNTFFVQAMQQQNRLRRLFEFGGYTNRTRARYWCREHLGIIEAVRNGTYAAAASLMRAHLSRAYEMAHVMPKTTMPPVDA